jgi:hypothetical protein
MIAAMSADAIGWMLAILAAVIFAVLVVILAWWLRR